MSVIAPAEINLFGEIDDASARAIDRQLRDAAAEPAIDLFIHSHGGGVDAGFRIIHAIERARQRNICVRTINAGACCSMASAILQAGTERLVATNSLTMIHSPRTRSGGTSADLRRSIDLLDKVNRQLVELFAHRSGQPASRVHAWLLEETWFDADEAISAGLADKRTLEVPISAASLDVLEGYHVPEKYVGNIRHRIERIVDDVELSARLACRTSNYDIAKNFHATAVRAAEKLTTMPGATSRDVARAGDAITKSRQAINCEVGWKF